jgi:hypothetical protein
MSMPCPICSTRVSDSSALAHHVADRHSADSARVTVIAAELSLPVVACDIDAIHTSAILAAKTAKAAA